MKVTKYRSDQKHMLIIHFRYYRLHMIKWWANNFTLCNILMVLNRLFNVMICVASELKMPIFMTVQSIDPNTVENTEANEQRAKGKR